MYVREDAGQIMAQNGWRRVDQVTYMNKGGTAERIGPCQEGLIVPAVLHFYTEKGELSWQTFLKEHYHLSETPLW